MIFKDHEYGIQKGYKKPPFIAYNTLEELIEAYDHIKDGIPKELYDEFDLFVGRLQWTYMRHGASDGLYFPTAKERLDK